MIVLLKNGKRVYMSATANKSLPIEGVILSEFVKDYRIVFTWSQVETILSQ